MQCRANKQQYTRYYPQKSCHGNRIIPAALHMCQQQSDVNSGLAQQHKQTNNINYLKIKFFLDQNQSELSFFRSWKVIRSKKVKKKIALLINKP